MLLLLPWMTFVSRAQSPQWEWARSISSGGYEIAKQVAVDPASDHVYVVGDWDSDLSATFPGGANPSTQFNATYGLMDGYVAKYDQDGNLIWAFKVGGVNDDQVNSIAIDTDGNIYITGMMGEGPSIYFSGTSTHTAGSTLSNASDEDFFLAKFSPEGEFIWVRRSNTDTGDLNGQDLTLTQDAVYAVGNATGRAFFGILDMASVPNANDIFLVKYSLDGTESWITQAGSNQDDLVHEVVADEVNVYYIGHYYGSNLTLRNASGLTAVSENNAQIGSSDIIVAAYDLAGTYAWSQTIASVGDDEGLGITLDADSLYITGAIHNNSNFPGYAGNPVPTSAERDIFLASLAKSDGNTGWVQVLPCTGSGNEQGRCLDIDVFGNIYVIGDFNNDLQFPQGITLSSIGNGDIFVASYTAAGDFRWAESAGSSNRVEGYGLATDRRGSLYISGRLEDDMNLGPFMLTYNGNNDGFLAKIQDTIIEEPFADPGPYGDVCGSTLGLQAVPSTGTGVWSMVSGPGNATFMPSENDTIVSIAVDQYGSYTFAWTETNILGSDDSTFTVEFFEPTLASAGLGGDTCSLNFGLNASPTVGQGQWSLVAGPGSVTFLPSDTVPNAIATVSALGSYIFQWNETNGICSSIANVTVNYITPPPVDPGAGGLQCGLTFALNAVPSFGTGSWSRQSGPGTALFSPSVNASNASVTVSESGTYEFLWTESDAICSNDSAIVVTFVDMPVARAGTGGENCGPQFQLSAVPSFGTGIWTQASGPGTAIFAPSTDVPDAMVSVDIPGLYEFIWTETNGTCVSQESIEVDFLQNLGVDAGPDVTVCGLQHALNVLPQDVPGFWTTRYGPGNVSFSPSDTDPMARITVNAPGEYLFKWEVSQGFCAGEDSVLVTFSREATANAGPDQVLDYEFTTHLEALTPSADVAAVNASGTWALLRGSGIIENPGDPSTRVSGLGLGENVFQWTISSAHCPDVSDEVSITVNDVQSYTVITPNNDGLNDMLVFPGIENIRACEIIIYNRWGTEVYRNADYQNNWDGRDRNERPLIQDTYYYILRIPPDRIIKSFVEIRRSQ